MRVGIDVCINSIDESGENYSSDETLYVDVSLSFGRDNTVEDVEIDEVFNEDHVLMNNQREIVEFLYDNYYDDLCCNVADELRDLRDDY